MSLFGYYKPSRDSACIWTGRRNLTLHRSRWAARPSALEFAIRLGIYAYGWGDGEDLFIEPLNHPQYLYEKHSYKVRSEGWCRLSSKGTRTIEVCEFEVHAAQQSIRDIHDATIEGLKSKKESYREEILIEGKWVAKE